MFVFLVAGAVLVLAACQALPTLPARHTATPTLSAPPTVIALSTRPVSGPTAVPVTPTPSLMPSASPTPGSPTAGSTPFAIATPTPSSEPASKLVFIADLEGRLALWDPARAALSLLAYQVVDFTPSPDGKKLALMRARQTVGDEQRFSLEVHDLASDQSQVLVETSPEVYHLGLSADGRYLAYTTQEQGGRIELLENSPDTERLELAACQGEPELVCTNGPVWAPDRLEVAWGDSQGVWLSPVDDSPTLAIPASVAVTDPRGGTSRITVRYERLSWSPFGRYLLAKVSPLNSEVHWWGLLDTKTGRQAEIPGTYELGQESAQAAWMGDGRVMAGLPGRADSSALPRVQVWSVLPTRDDLLLSDLEINLPLEKLPWLGDEAASAIQYSVAWLSAYRSRYLSFGVTIPDSDTPASLFLLDVKYGHLEKINELPASIQGLSWSTTSLAGLAWRERRQILYLPGDGSQAVNLLPEFGPDAHRFTWIPPRSSQ